MGASSTARVLLIAGVASVGIVPACLPAGQPPDGHQLLTGRDEEAIYFVPGPLGQPSSLLVRRPSSLYGSRGADVWSVITDSDGSGPAPAAREIIYNADLVTCPGGTDCGPQTDSLGRLYFRQVSTDPFVSVPGGPSFNGQMWRIDPQSGEKANLGDPAKLLFSADRTQTAALTVADQVESFWTVEDASARQTILPGTSYGTFAGGDFIFVTKDSQLRRLRADGVVESLLDGVMGLTDVSAGRGPLLALTHLPPLTKSLFEPTTSIDTPLPAVTAATSTFYPSPDGRYLVALISTSAADRGQSFTVARYDRDTSQEVVAGPFAGMQSSKPIWRPGTQEFWMRLTYGVWSWKPDQDLTPFASWGDTLPFALSIPGDIFFTTDGRYWLWTGPWVGQKTPVFARSADDADAPSLRLNPEGTGMTAVWPLQDGRLVVEDSISDTKRNDIYLVDPAAGVLKPLANGGNIVAVGSGRCLALLHWASGSVGDLTLIDFATGAQTLLAENVLAVTVDKNGPSAGSLEAGTRVAYVVGNRLASPFDGLWVTTLR